MSSCLGQEQLYLYIGNEFLTKLLLLLLLLLLLISLPLQTGPVAHPASQIMGPVKQPGWGVNHPPHLELRLKKE